LPSLSARFKHYQTGVLGSPYSPSILRLVT
jgi:hypothetical protein